MRHTFAKGMGLALAAALTLTGCNLIEVDEVLQAKEDIAKITKAQSVAAATYEGGEVTVAEAMEAFNNQYNYMYQMYYYYFGTTLSEEDVKNIAEDTVKAKVENEIVAAKFDAANTLTEEQAAEAATAAEEEYNSIHEQALSESAGKNDEGKEANAQVLLTRIGATKEQIEAEQLINAKVTQMKQMLCDEITEVTDEELQAAYDEQVESDKTKYEENPASYGSDMTNATDDTIITFVPEGYRTVRHILVIPEESVLNAYTDAKSALTSANSELTTLETELSDYEAAEDKSALRTEEEIKADIDAKKEAITAAEAEVKTAAAACLENVSAKTTEIYAKLAEGAAFGDVMAEYGEDPGMQDEAKAAVGYYVCADSTNWQSEFTEGAMALANVGDYSAEPVVSGSGVHIIEYFTDVKGGTVALEEIKDKLYAKTLTTKQETHRDETIAAWVEEAKPVYNPSVLISVATEA